MSEPYWKETGGVAVVPAASPPMLADAADRLMSEERNPAARTAAAGLYLSRFAPDVALAPLFDGE